MNKLFTPDAVDEFEKIIISESNTLGKKNGFKDVIEPAKVKALNYADPVFKGQGVWKMNGGKFGRDYVFTNNRSMEHLVEYKLSIRERHDQVNCGKVGVEDYMVLSQEQFERYMGEPNKTIFFERLICNFDASTKVGEYNLLAHKLGRRCNECESKGEARMQWDYLFYETKDFKNWKQRRDFEVATVFRKGKKEPDNKMIVLNKNNAPQRINLDEHLWRAYHLGVLLSRYHGTTKTKIRKALDELLWVQTEDSILDFP